MSPDERTFKGQCYCGAVTIEVTGDPEGAGYCHCAACRSWSAGPVNAFTLWKPEAVKVTQGEDQIGEYNKAISLYNLFIMPYGACDSPNVARYRDVPSLGANGTHGVTRLERLFPALLQHPAASTYPSWHRPSCCRSRGT